MHGMSTDSVISVCALGLAVVLGSCTAPAQVSDIKQHSDTGGAYSDDRPGPEKIDTGPSADKVVAPDTGDENSLSDSILPGVGKDCKACKNNADCGKGYDCIILNGNKACLKKCQDNGDCVSGYICYKASTMGKNCVPPSYKCLKCAAEGCAKGEVCDFSSGACVKRTGLCGICNFDWECGANNRCYHRHSDAIGVCVPECETTADCPEPRNRYTCQEDKEGVRMCMPDSIGVCCPADRPVMLSDGTCAQCSDSKDCAKDEICNDNHVCSSAGCSSGMILCADDNKCHECCEDADCLHRHCVHHSCGYPPGCGSDACNGPNYPYCVYYQGKPTCAACDPEVPESCPSPCICSPDSFNCEYEDGSVCWNPNNHPSCQDAWCSDDEDCVNPYSKAKYKCGPSDLCYATDGSCDGDYTCCDPKNGSKCYDLMPLFFGSTGGIPGMPQDGTMMGVCSCGDGVKCPGGGKCYELDVLCKVPLIGKTACPDGKLPPKAPKHICQDPMSFINGT